MGISIHTGQFDLYLSRQTHQHLDNVHILVRSMSPFCGLQCRSNKKNLRIKHALWSSLSKSRGMTSKGMTHTKLEEYWLKMGVCTSPHVMLARSCALTASKCSVQCCIPSLASPQLRYIPTPNHEAMKSSRVLQLLCKDAMFEFVSLDGETVCSLNRLPTETVSAFQVRLASELPSSCNFVVVFPHGSSKTA